jgi:hypothetical protein
MWMGEAPGRGLISTAFATHRQLGVRIFTLSLPPPISIRGGPYVPALHRHPASAENSLSNPQPRALLG